MKERPKNPMEKLTIPGRLLVIATICFAGGFFYWNVMFINDHFPAGHYSIAFIAIPVVIGSAIFFGIFYRILKFFGIRFQKNSSDKIEPTS